MMIRRSDVYWVSQKREGVALILVLLTLFTLGVMAGIFAYAMKVETRLAANTTSGTELEWLGRSGVEIAKWILVQQETQIPSERGYTALNQFWAGGSGPVDSVDNPFAGMSLREIPVGEAKVSIEITDQERWININSVHRNPLLMEQALSMAGAGAADASAIGASLIDWIDRNDIPEAAHGAESEFYRGLPEPIQAKNGAIDDLQELLLVRGVTPEIFWGRNQSVGEGEGKRRQGRRAHKLMNEPSNAQEAGLVQIFCAISSGRVNVNTASESVLCVLLNGDSARARDAVRMRNEMPARDAGDIARILGGPAVGPSGNQMSAQSYTFSIRVSVQLGAARGSFVGLVARSGARDYQTLQFRRE
jgi:general secretion pathway protein K